jgi:hypothetical protein
MTTRSSASEPAAQRAGYGNEPTPDIAAFIRYCHARRGAAWPELYDEMCAVAARREFNGWDHDELADRGVTFTLLEMPKLAGWARTVLAGATDPRPSDEARASNSPRLGAHAAVA